MTPPPLDCAELVADIRDRLVNPLTGLRLHLEDLRRVGRATSDELTTAIDVVSRIDAELERAIAELRCRVDVATAG